MSTVPPTEASVLQEDASVSVSVSNPRAEDWPVQQLSSFRKKPSKPDPDLQKALAAIAPGAYEKNLSALAHLLLNELPEE